MSDSELHKALAEKHRANREQRILSIKRWVRYLQDEPPEVWGPQQNRLINAQLRSARDTGLDAAHYRRVDQAGRDP